MYLIAIGVLCQWRGRWEWETLVGGGKALGWGLFVDLPLGSRLALWRGAQRQGCLHQGLTQIRQWQMRPRPRAQIAGKPPTMRGMQFALTMYLRQS